METSIGKDWATTGTPRRGCGRFVISYWPVTDMGSLMQAVEQLGGGRRGGMTVIVEVGLFSTEENWPVRLSQLPIGCRMVLVGVSDRWTVSRIRQHVPDAVSRVVFETDLPRAVITAMLSLRDGDHLSLLIGPWRMAIAREAVEQGLRWRSSWETPSGGEFHDLPPELVQASSGS
ncbi:MAG: hypothetical protein N2039_07245 [Gemmataceae bacterium]|nr:hypothetical protein [Gemmataceae bacterium]